MLQDASRAAATFVGRLTVPEQAAHKIARQITERLADDNAAVSIAEIGKETAKNTWALAVYFQNARDKNKVRDAVIAAAGRKAAGTLRFSRLDAADWVGESLQRLAPVGAGRFLVHGAHDRGRIAINRVGIEIEAALAFGSGHHGTTRGCLLAFDRICKSSHARRILDLGTGSGVLAIAAARVLRQCVQATDIDAEAVRVAHANARLNRSGGLVHFVRAPGVSQRAIKVSAPFDLVFANILLEPLQRFAAPLKKLIAPGGCIVLSGLLAAQANAAITAYRPLALERRINIEGWTTLVMRRGSPSRAGRAYC